MTRAIVWYGTRWDNNGLKYCAAPQSNTAISFFITPSASPSALAKALAGPMSANDTIASCHGQARASGIASSVMMPLVP